MDSMERAQVDRIRAAAEMLHSNRPIAGMERKDLLKYSISRAILGLASGNPSGLEHDMSQELEKKYGRASTGNSLLVHPAPFLFNLAQRDANVASAGAGGYLVETDNVGFVEVLRNRSVCFRMGARPVTGLVGNVTIPKQTGGATGYWLSAETSQVTESTPTFAQVSLTPKTVGGYTEISRQLLMQSNPSAERVVQDDLAGTVATASDAATLNGSGSVGEPLGLLNTSGVGSVTGTSLGFAGVLEFQTDVAGANETPTAGGYVTTPAIAALMKQRARFSNTDTPLWQGNVWDGQMEGFRSMSSNQVPTAKMIFGDWSEVLIGQWGTLELVVNPYTNFTAGIIGVRAMLSMDVAVRRPAAFSIASSIT